MPDKTMSLTQRLRMASPLQKKEVSVSRIDAVEEEFIWVIVSIQAQPFFGV
jgi:hypothetical protein